jgi:hypothetical protein
MAGKTAGGKLALLVAAMLVAGLGCQRGEVPAGVAAPASQGQPTVNPQDQALQELLRYAQETGRTLEQVRQDLEQLAVTQKEGANAAAQADLAVLAELVTQAKERVGAKDAAQAGGLLTRMGRVARSVLAEMPAQKAAVQAERALSALGAATPDTARAARAIAAGLDEVSRVGGLVSADVTTDLKGAAESLQTKPDDARKWLAAALDACAADRAAVWAYYMTLELTGAYQDVQREAWGAAAAQLDQVQAWITGLQSAAASQTPAAGATGTGTTAGGSGTGAAQGATGGGTPAPGQGTSGTPPATGTPPAAGTSAPVATPTAGQSAGAAQPPQGGGGAPPAPASPAKPPAPQGH